MVLSHAMHTFALALAVAFMAAYAHSANAVEVDLRTISMSMTSDSVSFEVEGIAVTATGHHAPEEADVRQRGILVRSLHIGGSERAA